MRFASEEDSTQESIVPSGPLASGTLKIARVERSKVGSDAEMAGVVQHGAKGGNEGAREAITKSRGDDQNVKGVLQASAAMHADSFVEIDTEHGVSSLEALNKIEVDARFRGGERSSPVKRDGTNTDWCRAGRHFRDLRGANSKYSKELTFH
ncbi:MAG TPA: hypothetical protein VGF19_07455 [Candidatus Acidoferrum sp.]